MVVTFDHTVTRNDEDVVIEIEALYTPGAEAVYTLSNGDPGYPAEPETVEVLSTTPEVDLTDEELEEIYEVAIKQAADAAAEDFDPDDFDRNDSDEICAPDFPFHYADRGV